MSFITFIFGIVVGAVLGSLFPAPVQAFITWIKGLIGKK
jgi:hypothetical protein